MSQNPFVTEFPIGRFSGHCAACGELLKPGSGYYAVIWPGDGQYVRKDFDERCWTSPPAQAVGVWRAKVPAPEAPARPRRAPAAVVMAVFERLGEAEGPSAQKLRLVVALLLVRRRLLRQVGSMVQGGLEWWRLRRAADEQEFEVACPALTDGDVEELSRQLGDLLAGLDDQAESV